MYVANSVTLLEENISARAMLGIIEQCSVVTACTDWFAYSRGLHNKCQTKLALTRLALATWPNSVTANLSK